MVNIELITFFEKQYNYECKLKSRYEEYGAEDIIDSVISLFSMYVYSIF